MLDIRASLTPRISHVFALASNRAMQCPAIDPKTGEFYVSQAQGTIKPESIQISRNSLGPIRRRLSTMRLVKAGHGSMIAVLRRNGVLGIVTNAWGALVWVPYRPGDIVKGDARTEPIWRGTYAYIDHEAQTVCLGAGGGFTLYELVGDQLGKVIGKTVRGVTSTGPGQGFCTIKSEGAFYLFTMWDYGRARSRPTVAAGSFATGGLLYRKSARVLPSTYTRQEPEAGFGIGGVFHLGMSVIKGGKKQGVALAFHTPRAAVVVPPPAPMALEGNDVASYQPLWAPKPADGFAFVKATQGTGYANPFRASQIEKSRKLGLVVGHYHFLEPGNPVGQAAHFIAKADTKPGDLLWCDFEGDWAKNEHPSVSDAAEFMAEVSRLRPENLVGLYCNASDWASTAVKSGDALWIAEYGVKVPSIPAKWDFWQYTDKPIDQNRSRFTNMADLRAWANSKKRVETPMAGIYWRSRRACSCVIDWTAAFEKKLGRPLSIYQGSYSSGVSASAGTHSGGGSLDVHTMSRAQLATARRMGAAAWNRTRAQGFTPHCHLVICGCPHASPGAKYQVSEYRAGRNGLANRGNDDGPRVGYTTWASYNRAQKVKAAARAKALAAAKRRAKPPAPIVIGGKKYPGISAVSVHYVNKSRAASAFSRHTWYVQRWLSKLGLYKGVPDGRWNDATQAAFDRFRAGLGWKGKDITGPVGLKSLGLLNDKARSSLPVKAK